MIANISPVLVGLRVFVSITQFLSQAFQASGSETLSTIRFASRAKLIQNRPTKFLDPKMKRIAEVDVYDSSIMLVVKANMCSSKPRLHHSSFNSARLIVLVRKLIAVQFSSDKY